MSSTWVDNYHRMLYHHGIKGQKWGVRNGPPYPLNRNHNKIVKEAIASGKVSTKVNREKQSRHLKGSPGYVEGRSYIDGDLEFAQNLIDKFSGTGAAVLDQKGNWTNKERIVSPQMIGSFIDANKKLKKTNKAMIVYSKTGSHIYLRKG